VARSASRILKPELAAPPGRSPMASGPRGGGSPAFIDRLAVPRRFHLTPPAERPALRARPLLVTTLTGALILTGSRRPSLPSAGEPMKPRFTFVSPGFTPYPGTLTMAWGDLDGDGDLDLPLYLNNGDGTFSEIPGFRDLLSGEHYHGAAWCDYDKDGDLDLILPTYNSNNVRLRRTRLLQNLGNLNFRNVATELRLNVDGSGETPIWGDYDGDGWPDLFVPYYSHIFPYRSFLYRNNRDGTFTDVTFQAGVALAGLPHEFRPEGAHWADYDDDGDLDFYCAHHLFRNNSDGTFTDVREASGLPQLFDEGAEFVDYDNDGDLDLYIRTLERGRLFRNVNGRFSEVTADVGIPLGGPLWGGSWADVNHDGYLDLLYFRRDQPALLLVNRPSYMLLPDDEFEKLDIRADSSAWGDYDNDGDLDVVIGAQAKRLGVSRLNENPAFPHSYLRVRVLDEAGCFTQHGATVRLRQQGDKGVQTRVVDGGSGYLTQNQYDAHFGVQPDAPCSIAVSFPSRSSQRIVVDEHVNAALGGVIPASLRDKVITVDRVGHVQLDGRLFSPGGGASRVPPHTWKRY